MTATLPEFKMPERAFLDFVVLEVGTTEDGKREVSGLALPYDEELERFDWSTGANRWVFAQGSGVLRETTQLFYGHDHLDRRTPIGLVVASEQTPEGLRVTARISETAKGDEVYTLLKDGVLNRFSAGLRFVAYEITEADTGDPLLTLTEVDVFEVSVVPAPAYDSAVIDSVLDEHGTTKERNNMPENENGTATLATAEDVQALASSVTQIERQIATLGTNLNTGPNAVPFESYGETIKALARGDEEAVRFIGTLLAYAGGTIGDVGTWVKDGWVGDIIRYVEERRLVLNLFGTSPLPAQGNKIEYGKLLADTTAVAKQAAEGDVLAFGKVTWDTDTADVETRGGWGEMSRQEIERSPLNVVEKFFFYLLRSYAKYTETQTRAVAQTATGAHSVGGSDLSTADGWIRFLVESAVWLDDKGLVPNFVLLDKESFIDLATLRDGAATDAPRLLDRNSGQISVTGLTGDVFNVPVKLVGSFPADTVRVCSEEAIETFESPGAPFRLADEDITNLTKAFSIYGYGAVAAQEPDALVVPGV